MNNTKRLKVAGFAGAVLFAALPADAQEHKWAGRTLNDIEWRVHEELATLPLQGVFDTLRFEIQAKTVTLSGQVVRESVKAKAEAAVARIEGVEKVVNRIETLPSSERDEAIRLKVYRAIYQSRPLEKYGTRSMPPIHIIVKDGAVVLEGVVDSEEDRKLAYLHASKAARPVTTNLRVAPED